MENTEIIEKYRDKTKMSGCEMTDGQILFLIAELKKIDTADSFLAENGLEFANERTKQSVSADFEKLIFAPENKDADFGELFKSLVTDGNGEFIWDLFTPESGRKHRLVFYGEDGKILEKLEKSGNILPPCGNTDGAEKNNPFDKNSWNMTEQSKIYKENPEIAKYLASIANQSTTSVAN